MLNPHAIMFKPCKEQWANDDSARMEVRRWHARINSLFDHEVDTLHSGVRKKGLPKIYTDEERYLQMSKVADRRIGALKRDPLQH